MNIKDILNIHTPKKVQLLLNISDNMYSSPVWYNILCSGIMCITKINLVDAGKVLTTETE